MMKHIEFVPTGVCTQKISFDLVDGYIHHVQFTGGCGGNTKGVARLAEGLNARELAQRLKGIPCQGNTSCPDQLSRAIFQALEANEAV